jgi:hypothetical protein
MCALPASFIAPKLIVAATAEPMKGTYFCRAHRTARTSS